MTPHDGYTVQRTFGETVVEYRPMLAMERQAVRERADSLPVHLRESVWAAACWSHVVWSSGKLAMTQELILAIVLPESDTSEKADCDNLYHGTLMQQKFPALVGLSCETCQKWSVNPLTGVFQKRGGKLVERQSPEDLLCKSARGCPKGSPDAEFGLSEKNRRALAHDLDCRATGQWPNDAIVKRNARVIGLALMESRHAPT